MRLHRIALAEHAATAADAFSGRGGLFGNGRWHRRGQLVVYVAEHIALSMAECLVHLQRSHDIAPHHRWVIDVPDALILPPPALPARWKIRPEQTRAFGARWLEARTSVALLVPSAIVEQEFNCLINPAHPDFDFRWVKSGPHPFVFDPRLTTP